MHRRSFLKLALPLAALLAGCGRAQESCSRTASELGAHLRKFADPVLGKAAAGITLEGRLDSLAAVCESGLEQAFRQQAATDFAAGDTVVLDGWIVSRTEALNHRQAYLAKAGP